MSATAPYMDICEQLSRERDALWQFVREVSEMEPIDDHVEAAEAFDRILDKAQALRCKIIDDAVEKLNAAANAARGAA